MEREKTVQYPSPEDYNACILLLNEVLVAVKKKHPSWTIEMNVMQHHMMIKGTNEFIFDTTPVPQYFVYNAQHEAVFDILPLLNAHCYNEPNKWCIEAMYQLHGEDRDIIYFTREDDPKTAWADLEDYIA